MKMEELDIWKLRAIYAGYEKFIAQKIQLETQCELAKHNLEMVLKEFSIKYNASKLDYLTGEITPKEEDKG